MTWKKSGAIYDGDWKDDHRCGFGTYSVPEGGGYRKVYSGGWKNDKRHVCIHGIYRNVQLLSTTILIEFSQKTMKKSNFYSSILQQVLASLFPRKVMWEKGNGLVLKMTVQELT